METKICKQCGEIKPLEQYRKYYGGRKGTYNTCKACERINSREKYLAGKVTNGTATDKEFEELQKIHQLWEYQVTLGLRPPRQVVGTSTPMNIDDMLDTFAARAESVKEIIKDTASVSPPAELLKWLTEELTEEPEYYQDDIYDELKEKYRPRIFVDPKTLLPVYDDTYKDIMDKIAARFDEYEDTYYEKE